MQKRRKKGTRRSECPKEPVCLDCLDFFFASASLYLYEKYNRKCSCTDYEEDPDVVHLVTGRRIRIRLLLSSNNLKLNRYRIAVLEGNGDSLNMNYIWIICVIGAAALAIVLFVQIRRRREEEF